MTKTVSAVVGLPWLVAEHSHMLGNRLATLPSTLQYQSSEKIRLHRWKGHHHYKCTTYQALASVLCTGTGTWFPPLIAPLAYSLQGQAEVEPVGDISDDLDLWDQHVGCQLISLLCYQQSSNERVSWSSHFTVSTSKRERQESTTSSFMILISTISPYITFNKLDLVLFQLLNSRTCNQ